MCRHLATITIHETLVAPVTVGYFEHCIDGSHETQKAEYADLTHAEALDCVDGLMTSWWERQKAVYGAEATI